MNTLVAKIAKASQAVGALSADKENAAQKYFYISADKILERAGDALADVGVVLFPSIQREETQQVDYTDSYGKAKSRFDACVHFAMILSDGETQIELAWCGRGSDFSVPDKALYKAITSGHKYFLMKLLNVGVGNEDGEHETITETPAPAKAQAARQNAPMRRSEAQPQHRVVDTTTGEITPPQPATQDSEGDALFGKDVEKLHRHFHALGKELYGEQWDSVRERNVLRVTGNRTSSSKELLPNEVQKLIDGMSKLKKQPEAA